MYPNNITILEFMRERQKYRVRKVLVIFGYTGESWSSGWIGSLLDMKKKEMWCVSDDAYLFHQPTNVFLPQTRRYAHCM
jgi:hypothetical protein